ncbi:MarR family winged helix-turn-helix transcriptional regulator [Labedaea rhizosphaerae]|uniref:DNA-binding MarR family transcriptional regulator n=1 Tax=Labedaea rhizosphaerae TaxID=598644 RepID=A0A4R6SI30_LABRH|nr:MarR family transcriptional regulator [Labedaea rhizosphaerae]TDQ01474.1 DNA-binding MarR family transcriptional regulator [Labedaea rhizosphaerae]
MAQTTNVAHLLKRLGDHAHRRLAVLLEPLGLRPRHLGLLALVEEAPMAQLDLARAVGVAPSVVVDMLDELDALGAVRRVRDRADRRRQLVELTDAGRALHRKANARLADVETEMIAPLSPSAANALRKALTTLAAQL